ncbi:MAG: hypothetical protein LBT78_04115 [Tannerella sp.]|nr:hypothetical protein [Tannerella sp.]
MAVVSCNASQLNDQIIRAPGKSASTANFTKSYHLFRSMPVALIAPFIPVAGYFNLIDTETVLNVR